MNVMRNNLISFSMIHLMSCLLFAQESSVQDSSVFQNEVPLNQNGSGFTETSNRLPLLLKDVKVLLTDAIIADSQGDTLEVIYNLDRIYELLSEADQLGEKTVEDEEEFERFESALLNVVTQRLFTLEINMGSIAAVDSKRSVEELMEPMEVEMGASKFIVVDDRDGHIPLVRNKSVDQFISYFQNKGRRQFEIWLDRYFQYGPMLKEILNEYELPEELAYLAMIESGLNPKAYSRAKATGMWQFMYSTGKKYGLQRNWYIDERRDPEKATHAAAKFLLDLYKEFDHWYLALAAYNGGPGRVHRATRLHQTSDFWQLHSLPRETRNYIPYYLAAAIIASNPTSYGFKTPKTKQHKYEVVEIKQSADLAVLANSAGTSLKTLKAYNPELRQSATPVDVVYRLKIPVGKKEQFVTNFNSLPSDQRFAPQYVAHKVKRGESLWTISKKYRVSIHDLAAVNKIRNRHRLSIGQKLTIPVRRSNGGTLLASNSGPSGHKKVIYKVKRGDTLGHIAEDYNTMARSIRRWNKLEYGQHIFPGQKLTIWIKEDMSQLASNTNAGREKVVHKVKRGDTIGHIAESYRVSSRKIMSWNNIKSKQHIYPGQKLNIWVKNNNSSKSIAQQSSNKGKKVTYTVKRGDTIGHIADDYNTTVSNIRSWNNMKRSSYIKPGQKLSLWIGSNANSSKTSNDLKIYYTVKRGDTLSKIAENHRVRMASIMKWNKLNKANTIFPGQKLAIWIKQG
ncbi:MAG: LysM peptidoglycan-binding domain-containing protein [Candidatus Neomarinimicrobiota bacterium]|nr:LysM peptidoglycan-binding domain-containing protein [Candidatus Neomarinimicrobiota bacterium]